MPPDPPANEAEPALGNLEHLKRSLWHQLSAERLALYRNLGFGAAAVCLAILLAATQVADKTSSIHLSMYAAIVGMPAWYVYGGLFDYYMLLGKRSYVHFHSDGTQRLLTSVFTVAATSLFVAVAALCQFLLPHGAAVFVGSSIVAAIVSFKFHMQFAHWWRNAPSSPQDGDA